MGDPDRDIALHKVRFFETAPGCALPSFGFREKKRFKFRDHAFPSGLKEGRARY
jgi:hypothetical protein